MGILSVETTLPFSVLLPILGSTLKRKEFAPVGANSFHFRVDPFVKVLSSGEASRKSKKLSSFVEVIGDPNFEKCLKVDLRRLRGMNIFPDLKLKTFSRLYKFLI